MFREAARLSLLGNALASQGYAPDLAADGALYLEPAPVRRADDPRPDPRPAPVAAARRLLPSDRYAIAVFAAMVLASVPLLSLTVDPAFLWLGTALAGVLCLWD